MELLILNDVDYTKHIVMNSYKVQREPVTKTWEDATYTMHADLLRWRLAGSFTIYFDDRTEFTDFLNTLNNLRGVDNYVPATVYDNGTQTQKTSRFNFKLSLVNDLPYYGVKKHEGYVVQIEEQ